MLYKLIKIVVSTTLLTVSLLLAPVALADDTGWPGWGGPNGDFTVKTRGVAKSWPTAGPKRLWQRELGVGYSSIVTDGAVLKSSWKDRAGLLT